MIKTTYQTPELRDANDNVVQEGAFGKNTALSNSTNDAWIDYVMNDLEALHDTIGDSAPTLDGNGHVVEPANLAIGDEDGIRLKTGYLKTSGGTVSGTLNIAQNLKMQDNQENVFGGLYVPGSTATEQHLILYGGESYQASSNQLRLYSTTDGYFLLRASNGTNNYDLVGNGNTGTLNWRGYTLAWDKDCVHLADAQTISGVKTFDAEVVSNPSGGNVARFTIKHNSTEKGVIPSVRKYMTGMRFLDKNDENLFWLQGNFNNTGQNWIGLYCFNNLNAEGVANSAFLGIGQLASGQYYTQAPNPTSLSSNDTSIATTQWVTSKVNGYLPTTGGTINGSLVLSGNNRSVRFQHNTAERGNITSNTGIGSIPFYDKDGNQLQYVLGYVTSAGESYISTRAARNTESTSYADVALHAPTSGDFYFSPRTDNVVLLGKSSMRWKQLYAATTTISTSDERMKDNITAVPDEVLDAWGDVSWYQYQFKDSIAEKGENARIHAGAIAQRIESVFESHGLDANKYGLLCYDEWKSEPAERDENGNLIRPAQPAGNRYSLRYEEALCMEAAYQRRRADRLEERIARLEALISE